MALFRTNYDKTDPRAELAARLRGQSIEVRNILRIYNGWDLRPHCALEASRHDIEQLIRVYIPTEEQRTKARQVESAFCASVFWPGVSTEKLIIMGRWMIWAFLWDDEIDCGLLRHESSKTQAYVNDSTAFVRHCLQPELKLSPPPPGLLHNCGPWVSMAEAMLVDHSVSDRTRYVESTLDYLKATGNTQIRRLAGVEQLDAYMDRRARNVGIEQCLTILPWAYGLALPSWIWEHEAMKRCVREVIIAVFLCNDIFSVKKELMLGDVDSVIPILVYHQNITVQEATDVAIEMIAQSYRDFLAASQHLEDAARLEDDATQRDIRTLLRGCTDVMVGNVMYSMYTPRYIARDVFDTDCHKITLVL
jgi:hypothetical protein